jgi:hypothetical protein
VLEYWSIIDKEQINCIINYVRIIFIPETNKHQNTQEKEKNECTHTSEKQKQSLSLFQRLLSCIHRVPTHPLLLNQRRTTKNVRGGKPNMREGKKICERNVNEKKRIWERKGCIMAIGHDTSPLEASSLCYDENLMKKQKKRKLRETNR